MKQSYKNLTGSPKRGCLQLSVFMEKMVKTAIAHSGKELPLTVVTISAEGEILKTQRF